MILCFFYVSLITVFFSEVVFIHRVPHLISLCDYFPSPKDHFVGCCDIFCILNVVLCVFMDVFGHLK